MSAPTDRWTEIRKIHVESVETYRILGGVVLVGLGIWIGSILFAGDNGYSTNLYTELISIGVTVFILDFLNRRRDEKHRIQELKERLLREVRSPENSVAKHAIHELREYGWLKDETGLLRGADLAGTKLQEAELSYANLRGADLAGANLRGADLVGSNLHGADLVATNLQGTGLEIANLQGADLVAANLQEANLLQANLQGAYLWGANLKGAYLWRANLQGAYLTEAVFDQKTVLPDGAWAGKRDHSGTPIYTPESYYQPHATDMARYTDPNHPDFWQPEWVKKNSNDNR